MISALNLRKAFGAIQAVDDVSLELKPGETFGLLGPNGAGKTTTIHMLVGAIRPDSGKVSIQGATDPTRPQVRQLIGLAPQVEALYEELTGQENLTFFAKLYGLTGNPLRDRVSWALELAGLTDRQRDRVKGYSGGMKRRLNLACAMVHDPKVLFLDEPTAGVDPQSRNHLLTSIEALAKAGSTILYTTHYMEEAQRLCNRVAIMDHGKILALDSVDGLLKRYGGMASVEAELAQLPPPGKAPRRARRAAAAVCFGAGLRRGSSIEKHGHPVRQPAYRASQLGNGVPESDGPEAARLMKSMLTLTVKDLRLLARDKMALFWVLVFPMIFGLFFGVISGGGAGEQSKIPIAFVDEDDSPTSQALVKKLSEHESLEVKTAESLQTDRLDEKSAANALRLGKLAAFVVLQKGFGESLIDFSGQNPPGIELGCDPARKAESGLLQGIIMEAAYSLMGQQMSDPKQMEKQIARAKEQLAAAQSMVPMQKATVQQFLAALNDFTQKVDQQDLRAGGPFGNNIRIKQLPIAADQNGPQRLRDHVSLCHALGCSGVHDHVCRVDGSRTPPRDAAPLARGATARARRFWEARGPPAMLPRHSRPA